MPVKWMNERTEAWSSSSLPPPGCNKLRRYGIWMHISGMSSRDAPHPPLSMPSCSSLPEPSLASGILAPPQPNPSQHQLLRRSAPGLFSYLWAQAAFDAQETPCNSIRSSLQGAYHYVLSGPCNDSPPPLCRELPCSAVQKPFPGRELICLAQIGCSFAQHLHEGLRNQPPLAETTALGEPEG